MGMQQYFLKELINDKVTFNNDDIHHIVHVMRLTNNDNVIGVFNNTKYLIKLNITKDNVTGTIVDTIDTKEEYIKVTLIHGMPKNDKFELGLQKATELGASTIVPFLSERSVIKIDPKDVNKKLERWNKIVKEASEQCERNSIPLIASPIKRNNLKDYLSEINIVCDESYARTNGDSIYKILKNNTHKSISILIGPEGGFSNEEFDYFHSLGFKSVGLGKRVLRSETAVIYALSVISMLNEEE